MEIQPNLWYHRVHLIFPTYYSWNAASFCLLLPVSVPVYFCASLLSTKISICFTFRGFTVFEFTLDFDPVTHGQTAGPCGAKCGLLMRQESWLNLIVYSQQFLETIVKNFKDYFLPKLFLFNNFTIIRHIYLPYPITYHVILKRNKGS